MPEVAKNQAADTDFWERKRHNSANRTAYRRRVDIGKARSMIVDRVQPSSRVLDIGCGDGSLLEALRDQKGCAVFGIDIAPGAIDICRTRNVNAILGDVDAYDQNREIGDLVFSDYDVVIFSKSLQYVQRRDEILARLETSRIYIYHGNRDRFVMPWAASPPYRSPLPTSNKDRIRWLESFGFHGSVLYYDRRLLKGLNLGSLPLPSFLLNRLAANVVLEFLKGDVVTNATA